MKEDFMKAITRHHIFKYLDRRVVLVCYSHVRLSLGKPYVIFYVYEFIFHLRLTLKSYFAIVSNKSKTLLKTMDGLDNMSDKAKQSKQPNQQNEGNTPNDETNIDSNSAKINPPAADTVEPPKRNVKAIISLVLSIGSLFISFFEFFIGIPMAIIALVSGILSLREIKTTQEVGRKMAIAGIIISILSILTPFLLAALVFYLYMNIGG